MALLLWLVVSPLAAYGLVTWLLRMPERGAVPRAIVLLADRVWDEIRRLRPPGQLEPGELEVYRGELLGVTVHSIDRHVQIRRKSTCIVTNRRLVVHDARNTSVQIGPGDIETVRPYRTYDFADGFSFSVVLKRIGSTVHEPEGDLRLVCTSQGQSQELAAAIEEMISGIPV